MSTAESTTQPRTLARAVEPSLDGETVLAVLRRTMLVSDATVRRAKRRDDGITLDGVRCKTNEIVRSGQILSIVIDDEAGRDESAVEAEPGPLSIAYEDDDLLVIDKPAGLVVHPGPGHENGTLCNFVAYHLRSSDGTGAARPVQRLDRTTSGLVVFAKNAHAQDRLQRQMHTRDFERTYLAVCTGSPDPESGVVDAPIVRITRGPSVFAVRADGKRAVTRYETLARWSCAGPRGANGPGAGSASRIETAAGAGVAAGAGAGSASRVGVAAGAGTEGTSRIEAATAPEAGAGAEEGNEPETFSLVKLNLETGRTHQIRLHMRHIGCPLLGDETYGTPSTIIGRAALHSWRLRLTHPLTGARIELACALPQDMRDALAGIGRSARCAL